MVENEHSFFVCMFTTILVSWFQSKKQLATEAVKFKLDSLNPVNGLKRIFGLKTVKESVKAILYIIFFALAIKVFWSNHKSLLFKTLDGDIILGRDAIPSHTVLSRQYDNCLNF